MVAMLMEGMAAAERDDYYVSMGEDGYIVYLDPCSYQTCSDYYSLTADW